MELNKGEARNALARAICFHRLGRLRDRAVEAQQYRASGLAVVTASIALWNTVYLGRARDDLHLGGEVIADALLAHLAPVGWQHINLTGFLNTTQLAVAEMEKQGSGHVVQITSLVDHAIDGVPSVLASLTKVAFPRKSGHRVTRISPLPAAG